MSWNRIAIVGGGVYAATLAEELTREVAGPVDLRLVARRFQRLQSIAGHAERRVAAARPDWRVTACPSVEEAVRGASVIILMIRVGGPRARAHDEAFPPRHGLVGDEGIGVGGVANAWRTVPVLTEMALGIRRTAPDAFVLNLVAPLGITTRRLLDEGLRSVGVCELPLVTRDALLEAGATTGDLAYAGLNHLGWFWATGFPGERALASGVARGRIDGQVLAEFGAAPLHYYYDVFDVAAGRRLGRARRGGRAEELAGLGEEILAELRRSPGAEIPAFARRHTPWLDRALVPMVAALLGGTVHHGFADVRNSGRLPCVPADGVVEVEADVSEGRVTPRAPKRLPDAVSAFLRTLGQAEDLTYRAAVERDTGVLADALRRLPLRIPEERLSDLVNDIVAPVG